MRAEHAGPLEAGIEGESHPVDFAVAQRYCECIVGRPGLIANEIIDSGRVDFTDVVSYCDVTFVLRWIHRNTPRGRCCEG